MENIVESCKDIEVVGLAEPKVTLVHFPANAVDLMYAAALRCTTGHESIMLATSMVSRYDKLALIRRAAFEYGHLNILEMVDMVVESYGYNRPKSQQSMRARLSVFFQASQRYLTEKFSPFKYVVPAFIRRYPEYAEEYGDDMRLLAGLYRKWFNIVLNRTGKRQEANELARQITFGVVPTAYIDKKNLSAWRHHFGIRCCVRAEEPIRDYYDKVLTLLAQELPELADCFGANCVILGYCPEGKLSCGRVATLEKN